MQNNKYITKEYIDSFFRQMGYRKYPDEHDWWEYVDDENQIHIEVMYVNDVARVMMLHENDEVYMDGPITKVMFNQFLKQLEQVFPRWYATDRYV